MSPQTVDVPSVYVSKDHSEVMSPLSIAPREHGFSCRSTQAPPLPQMKSGVRVSVCNSYRGNLRFPLEEMHTLTPRHTVMSRVRA